VTAGGENTDNVWELLDASHYGVEMKDMNQLDLTTKYLFTTKEYKLPV
jgi:hypothetical protein